MSPLSVREASAGESSSEMSRRQTSSMLALMRPPIVVQSASCHGHVFGPLAARGHDGVCDHPRVCTNEQTPLIGASASRSSALSFVTLAGASGFLAEVSGAFRFVTSRLTGYSVPDTPSNLLQRGGSDCTVSHTSTS